MEIGIVGLPKCGKTTVFNALSKGYADISPSSVSATKPNLGVAKVQDPRLFPLEEMFHPQRTVPAEVRYIDFPKAPEGLTRSQGIAGEFLNLLQRADALLHVVRAFQDPSVPHIEGSVDPHRDLAAMNLELAFSDLSILERRAERLESELKGARAAERDAKLREHALLDRLKSELEREVPIREQQVSAEEARLMENFRFLTAKPMLIVWNIGEEDVAQAAELEEKLKVQYARPEVDVVTLCGKLEMELAEIDEVEAEEFRGAMSLQESGLHRVIRSSYGLLGLVSFFTVGPDEVKAWTIERDTPAVKAAGKIHSDIERGFIRAEVISYDHLTQCGSLAEGRKRGQLRLEGKTYRVQNGDVINFLFNV
ncbi:MAG: redox-regulated ATPase YchF [Chloroflexi bacterium]|nr:redox-regulated ATPase YchF [Chloroflexota bacterium]